MQILCMRKLGQIPEPEWVEVLKMQSHLEKIRSKNADFKQDVELMSACAREWSGIKETDGLSVELTQHIFTMVLTNALNLNTATFDPVGIALDPLACIVNHSCDPNALFVFEGPGFAIRALKPLQKGDEIFQAYIDYTVPFEQRQKELRNRYHFTCQCSKCIQGPVLQEDLWATPDNQIPNSGKVAKGKSPAIDESTKKQLEAELFEELAAIKAGEGMEAIQRSRDAISKCQSSGMFTLARQPYPAIRHELFTHLLGNGKWSEAWKEGLETLMLIDPILYPEPHHPLRAVHIWTLTVLATFLSSDPAIAEVTEPMERAGLDFNVVVFGLLRKLLSVVGKSHGEDSAFAGAVREKADELRHLMGRADPGSLKLLGDDRFMEQQWVKFRQMVITQAGSS